MGLRSAETKQKWIDWLAAEGVSGTYLHSTGSKVINMALEHRSAGLEDHPKGRYYVRRATLLIADDDTAGMLAADIKTTDRVTVGGRTWSVLDDGLFDDFGLITLNLIHVDFAAVDGRIEAQL